MRPASLALFLLCVTGGNSFAQSAVSLTAQSTPTDVAATLNPDETTFAALINKFRLVLNLPSLNLQPQLEITARNHSMWMNANDLLSHNEPGNPPMNPFQRMINEGYSQYTYAGENIACGNSDPVLTFRQWAFSPGHLVNMIDPHYHDMGIARAGAGEGTCPYYWTNDFGSTTDGSLDPAAVTDINQISEAIATVSGPIPPGTVVSLVEPTPTTTPIPIGSTPPAAVAVVAPTAPVITNAVSATAEILSFQCTIPYSVGQGTLTHFQNTDTVIAATRQADGSYSATLSYQKNGAPANIANVTMSNLTMTRNDDFPIFSLFSAPGSLVGGYSIDIDLGNNHSQFNSDGIEPQVSALVACSIRVSN